jgi:hypothetical protein
MNFTQVRLQQHFRNARRATEIAVYLERRMRIEEIRIGVSVECLDKQLVRMIAVEQARPETDFPSLAPARAHIATENQRLPGSAVTDTATIAAESRERHRWKFMARWFGALLRIIQRGLSS